MDPRTPVLVGAAQLSHREGGAEPIDMMARAAEAALSDCSADLRSSVQSVRVVKGIWPYADPGTLVAGRLGLEDVETALTQLGGNEAFDLVNRTAAAIGAGELDAALICSAETMRTRRADKKAGRKSPYLPERDQAEPVETYGIDRQLGDATEYFAGTTVAANFYAMAETALRHRAGESIDAHRQHLAEMWAGASLVAAENPHAWMREALAPEQIATPSDANRMVASPYPKLMTSNINVDQAAAVVMCSLETALDNGVPRDQIVFLHGGSSGHDVWETRNRWAFDESPALRIAGHGALETAGVSLDDIDLLDLYSCFPSAIQVAQRELGVPVDRTFTITGGLTFAGGPFNSYCMHSLARAVELLRVAPSSLALLSGNGGFFTKHSFVILGGTEPTSPFDVARPQAAIDTEPVRTEAETVPSTGVIDTYTVTYDRNGDPGRAIIAVLDDMGSRTLTNSTDLSTIDALLGGDACGMTVTVAEGDKVPISTIN